MKGRTPMIAQSMLPEFDHEFAALRRMLECVPEGKGDFTPHEKSMTLAKLAGHLTEISSWMGSTLEQDSLDFSDGSYSPYEMTTRADLLSTHDTNVAAARKTLEATSDETMMSMWSLKTGSEVHFTMPKIAVVRSFVMNHMIHHRAQLGVYLRLNGVELPGTYGPSADAAM